jgi:uncharacterized SAM-binding protein YcdF (DUF218 family)
MSATSALLWVLALWLAIGVVAGLVMGRRGHDPFEWLLLGAMLGPLALPVAVAITGHPDQAAPRQLAAGRSESTVPHRPRPPLPRVLGVGLTTTGLGAVTATRTR